MKTLPGGEAERLAAAGFSQERIAWADRRIDEVRVSVQQAQYNAQQSGQPLTPAMAARAMNPLIGLRDDMDDGEFERYLNEDIAKWAHIVKVSGAKAE